MSPQAVRERVQRAEGALREPFTAQDWKVHGTAADQYYQQLHAKHFQVQTATGSVFTDPTIPNLDALLARADAGTGGLTRDDREAYRHLPPGSLRDTSYYVRVDGVAGLSGATAAGDLPADTVVTVRTTKTGVPPDLVVHGIDRVAVTHATVVMVDERVEGAATGRRVVVTAFPGDPAAPTGPGRDELREGQQVRVGDLDPHETILIN